MAKSSVVTSNDIICAKQAALVIGCSPWTVYDLCKAGVLPHVRIGRLMRFRRTTLEAWLSQREAASLSRDTVRGRDRTAIDSPQPTHRSVHSIAEDNRP